MSGAQPVTSGLVDAGGTSLYHERWGSGPAVLLVSGGSGDAGQWAQMAPAMAEERTVVAYDRRGFSRSPRVEDRPMAVEEHADDAAALLRALGLAPATVVGHSSGATITCSLVVRHPQLLRHAVVFEPPLLAVVPDGRAIAAGLRTSAEQAMAEGGPALAMERFLRGNLGDDAFASIDAATRSRMLANGGVFFSAEMPAFAAFVPDRQAMRDSGVPVTVVTGADNRHTWFGAAAAWLAEGTGAGRVELPGGHGALQGHVVDVLGMVRGAGR